MIAKDVENKIILLHRNEKWPVGTIARQLGVHHSVVTRVLDVGGNSGSSLGRPRKIDPYVPFIRETLEKYPELRASRLFQMVAERGYDGAPDHFRTLVRGLRPERRFEAFVRLTTLAGEQAQVDWASFGKIQIGNFSRNLCGFLMVLSWSRQIFLRFYLSMETHCFLQGHIDAFEFFEGVPRELLHDNLKSAVLERQANLIQFNERYLSFASHYGFLPKACNVRRGNEKGRVERAVRYVRDNFFAGRKFRDLNDLNEQALTWCTGISQTRRCRADKALSVGQAFEIEKPKLLRLPDDRYPSHTLQLARSGKTNHLRFDRNDYSIPGKFVRQQITIQATTDVVVLLHDEKEIARHKRVWGSGETVIDEKHDFEILEEKKRAKSSKTSESLLGLIPDARLFLERMAEQGGHIGSSVLGIHKCIGEYGLEPVKAGIIASLKSPKLSISTLRIYIEKLQSEQGKPVPLSLSPAVEKKTMNIILTQPDLTRYDVLGGSLDE